MSQTDRRTEKEGQRNFSFDGIGMVRVGNTIKLSAADYVQLPTAAARVRAPPWSNGSCEEQSGAGTGFFRVLRFPLPIFIPPNSPSSQSPRAGIVGRRPPWSRGSVPAS
jgi:hypothetical protein